MTVPVVVTTARCGSAFGTAVAASAVAVPVASTEVAAAQVPSVLRTFSRTFLSVPSRPSRTSPLAVATAETAAVVVPLSAAVTPLHWPSALRMLVHTLPSVVRTSRCRSLLGRPAVARPLTLPGRVSNRTVRSMPELPMYQPGYSPGV